MNLDRVNTNLQTLLLIFQQALGAEWGVKVRIRTLGDSGRARQSFNNLFYKAKKMSPTFSSLRLLTTAEDGVFLILKGNADGKGRLEDDKPENQARDISRIEEIQ